MQHRMTFVDNWNILEQACLASAVRMLGDCETNWSTVCNFLKSKFSLIDRPRNWLTPESCEAQYKWLSDKYVKMEISCERPVNQIIQNLKQIGEYESKPVLEQENTYNELKKRLELVASNEVDSEIVMEFYEDSCKRNREREESMRKQGLKNDSPNATKSLKSDNKTDGTSPTTTSPLLSSLLNNPPASQYRPTLSTASFIPNKTTQGTSRTSYEKAHTSESSQRGVYSPNIGSQSGSTGERPNSFSPSTSSPARKLDFQDPSSSVISQESLSTTKESNRDTTWNNELAKSDVNNLENMNLIPTTEEFDPDILLQVIGNLQNKQALDKVLDELTSEKESIIDKDLNTVTIPLDDAFEPDSAASKDTVQILTLPTNSKTTTLLDSSLTNTEFEHLDSQYPVTENVIIIEDEGSNEQVDDGANVTSIEPAAPSNSATVNSESSVSSILISGPTESISDSKSDPQPLVEYLDTSAIENLEEKNIHRNKTTNVKLDSEAEISNENEVTIEKEPIEDYKSCDGIPRVTEMNDYSVANAVNIVEIPEVELEKPMTKCIEQDIEDEKEVKKGTATNEIAAVYVAPRPIQMSNTFDLENIPVSEPDKTEKSDSMELEVIENLAVEEIEQEHVPKTEVVLPEDVLPPSKISKLVPDPSVDADISLPILPPIVEEPIHVSTPTEEKPIDVRPSTYIQVSESHEAEKTYSKNRRQTSRRRRSTASESNDIPKIEKIEEPENTEKEEVVAKKSRIDSAVKDFQTESLDSELIVKSEEIAESVTPVALVSPTKTKNKSVEAKNWRIKPMSSRRSSIRSQNQNSLSPKSEETVASPSTPSSSRASDSAASKCKKSLVLSQQRLASQKYSSAFLKPISNRTVAGYEDVVYSPVDLHTIKRKIDSKVIKTVTEFEKDVLLMILNAKMFNRVNAQVYNMAVEMQKEAYREIQLTVQTLGEGVPLEVEESMTEKARKRQAVENLKRDQKPSKRSKPLTKDECLPVKRIKLEENESVI